jgi:hypothetical protein
MSFFHQKYHDESSEGSDDPDSKKSAYQLRRKVEIQSAEIARLKEELGVTKRIIALYDGECWVSWYYFIFIPL